MSNTRFILILCFFPLLLISLLGWLIYWKFWGKKQFKKEKQKKEWVKKILTHVKNFSPARLKNRKWLNISGKYKKKQKKKTKSHKKQK